MILPEFTTMPVCVCVCVHMSDFVCVLQREMHFVTERHSRSLCYHEGKLN